MARTSIKPLIRKRARSLRNEATRPEQRLWHALRPLRAHGFRFRRQTPIGPFIADFACLTNRLIIEVDGWTHSTNAEQHYDQQRTDFLKSQGFTVLRCTNDDVMNNDNGVVMEVLRWAGKA